MQPEPTETQAAVTEPAASSEKQEETFVPRSVEIKEAGIESVVGSAKDYLGAKDDVVDWKANLENGKYGPLNDDEDYVFVYPAELLDAMKENKRLPQRDNITDYVKVDMYRSSDDTAEMNSGESAWLSASVVKFVDIAEEAGQLKLLSDNIAAGLTADSHPKEDNYTADSGDAYSIEYTEGESGTISYLFKYLYGEDMIISGQLHVTSENLESFDVRTLDDIRCFFESLGIKNPLDVRPEN